MPYDAPDERKVADLERQVAELRAELDSIRRKTARSELVAQNLRNAQHKLDTHLDEFARMHEYARRAFAVTDRETLYATIVEGIVDVLQLEVAAVFEVNIADQQMSLLGSLNLETSDRIFPLPAFCHHDSIPLTRHAATDAVCESPVVSSPWKEIGLSSVIFMPFYDTERRLRSLMFGGVTRGGATVYDFVPGEIISPFMVYCQQMYGIMGLFDALEKANQAGRAKGRFLANLSHEIRTPMNAIIGMVQIAQRTDDHEEIERCIRQIAMSSKHLLGLINDVLDISKIEDGKFKLTCNPFNLGDVIESIDGSMEPLARNKSQVFSINDHGIGGMRLLGDGMRLTQVLINLLGNALKFTPEGGLIELDISEFARDEDGSTIRFAVSDTGIGIEPEFLERIFKPFEQADDGISRHYGGTGLGLAISQYIVELMGGDIRIESEPGKGTCFSFSIRFERDTADGPERKEEHDIKEETADFGGRRILIADDIKVNRLVLTSFLRGMNLVIDEVENGVEAVEKVVTSPPGYYALVFMDVQMPVMDGCTATRRIRTSKHPDASTLPIVAMTANVFKEDVREVLDAGMNGHIGKPVDFRLVVDTIRRMIDRGKHGC